MQLVRILVRSYLRPYFGQLGLAFFFMAVAAAMTASFAGLLEPVLDSVLINVEGNDDRTRLIIPMGLAILATFVVNGIATYIHTLMTNHISQSIVADIQRELFSHFLNLDLRFFHSNPSGQLVSRVISDVNVMRVAVSDSLTGIGKNLLTLIFLIGVMFYQDWRLSLIALTVFPLASLFVAYLGRRLRKVSHSIQNETANLMDTLGQIFQGIRQVQAYGMEREEARRAGIAVDTVRDLNIKSVRIGNLSTPMNEILVGLAICGIIIYGGYSVAAGVTTPGSLMSFIAAFSLAYEPMKKLAKLNNTLQVGLGAAERVLDMLKIEPGIQTPENAVAFPAQKPEITFREVGFSYDGEDRPALEDVSFALKRGEVTAIIGPSGGGKSTILNLIPRFYDVSGGAIEIEGIDIREIAVSDLRLNIALVSQDITIFDATVRANIEYGRFGAGFEEVRQAAAAAAALEFIEGMPEGFNTRVGENGVKLSGGQRQRIAIARAILRDAPVLLLDEATSALDNESERIIQNTLCELQRGRTTLVIAHRLSTVRNADQIIVLDNGRIVQKGDHKTLIDEKGLYATMYEQGFDE